MTREELKQEAEELIQRFEMANSMNCYMSLTPDRKQIGEMLVMIAEPREKRIAEQEELLNSTLEENKDIYKKMADLDTALEDCTESLTDARIKIKELEKENAELKERADKADLDSVTFFNQLCKAKELLEDLIKFQPYIDREAFFISLGNEWKTAIYKAEQFLKENK